MTWNIVGGDCRTVLKEWNTNKQGTFQLVLTDPPYRITPVATRKFGDGSTAYGSKPPRYEEWIPLLPRLMGPAASLYVYEHQYRWHELVHAIEAAGFKVLHTLIWHATNRQYYLARTWGDMYDVCVYAVLPPFKARTFNKSGYVSDVWTEATQRNDVGVPGSKPLGMLRNIIRVSSNPGHRVLDPFMGSGTTLLAAMHEGRDSVGIELRAEVARKVRLNLAQAERLTDFSDKTLHPKKRRLQRRTF